MKKFVVPEKILSELKRIKRVQGILLTGSQALGTASKNADWDFFVILDDGAPRWRRTSKCGDTWIEVFANDQKQIKKYFRENQKNGRGIDIFMFTSGVILKDDDAGTVRKLVKTAKKLWQKGPRPLSKSERAWIDYNIATYTQDLEDIIYDRNEALLLINHAIDEMVTYYYRLSRRWLPRQKDRLTDFQRREKKLYGIIKEIQRSSDWKKQANRAAEFGFLMGKRFNLKLTGEIYIAPEKKRSTKK